MCGHSDEKIFNIVGWIFQVAIWSCLILFLILHKNLLLIALIAAYLIYLLLEFISPTSRYLCNKSSQ